MLFTMCKKHSLLFHNATQKHVPTRRNLVTQNTIKQPSRHLLSITSAVKPLVFKAVTILMNYNIPH